MVACTAFLSFAYPDSFLGSPVILDGFGRLLRPVHLLEWAFTTPAMVFLLGQTCDIPEEKLHFYMAATFFNIVFGFLASWVHSTWLMVLYITLAFACFGWVVHGFWHMYQVRSRLVG